MRAAWGGAFLGLFVTVGVEAQALPSSDDCRDCHLTLEDARLSEPARAYELDVHAETGFGCLACHGSGGQGAFSQASGFLSRPERRAIPEMCGRCHSDAVFMRQFDPGLRVDQVTEYWTSEHGQLLRERNDPDVATCVDCHLAHGTRPASDPVSTTYAGNVVETCGSCHADADVMAGRDLDIDQVTEYSASVHGRLLFEEGDVSAPVCNDCHGNHGAAPPGLASIGSVCGECHSVMADYFNQSGHAEIFTEGEVAGCAVCHDHHAIEPTSDALLVDRSAQVCLDCHETGDTLGGEFESMAVALDSLARAVEAGRATLEHAENLGMEVSQALFELEDVSNVWTRARSAIHTFHLQPVLDEVTIGLQMSERAEERGREALAEHRFRRVGLGVFAGIVVLLIIGLLYRIKDLEHRFERLVQSVTVFYERSLSTEEGQELTSEQLRLAACGLLLEASYADGRITEAEREYLKNLLRVRFGLDPTEADELIELAERQRHAAGDVGRLAALIAEHFDARQKKGLLRELWDVVYADGELTKRETEFLESVALLIGMDRTELALTRMAAARRMPS